MAKIKILTFFYVSNYGAIMQAYALSQYLIGLNHEVKIIDYRPMYFEKNLKYEFVKHPINNIKSFLSIRYFKRFIHDFLPVTSRSYFSNEDLLNTHALDADIFIVGSDQVWNFKTTFGYDRTFLLNFVTRGRKFAYAASMGESQFPQEFHEEIGELLIQFEKISVRENYARQYIKNEFSIESTVTLDPTLLAINYQPLLNINHIKFGAYVCYFVRYYKINSVVLQAVSKISGNKIVNIGLGNLPFTTNTFRLSPRDWVSWLNYAGLVITNSFHGVVFSIVFKKKFIFIPNEESQYNIRAVNLLEMIGLSDRRFNDLSDLSALISTNVDYEEVYKKLERLRSDSNDFFSSMV